MFTHEKHVKCHYLCYFISGVPFDSEKDLGKDLGDVHAVVPGRERERDNYCVLHPSLNMHLADFDYS